MRAVDFAMGVVFINFGFAIVDVIGVFGSDISSLASTFQGLVWLTHPVVMAVLATTFALGTIVVLNSNAINDRGIAYTTFIGFFWGSVILTGIVIIGRMGDKIPGIQIFYTIYCIIAALVFINALVQMSTGGQKTHV